MAPPALWVPPGTPLGSRCHHRQCRESPTPAGGRHQRCQPRVPSPRSRVRPCPQSTGATTSQLLQKPNGAKHRSPTPPFPGTNPAPGQPRPPAAPALRSVCSARACRLLFVPGLAAPEQSCPRGKGGGGEEESCQPAARAGRLICAHHGGIWAPTPNAGMGGRPGCAAVPSRAPSPFLGHQAATSCCPLEAMLSPRQPFLPHHGSSPQGIKRSQEGPRPPGDT